eukprot:14956364-Ditylum_brightwellii.AAC.1
MVRNTIRTEGVSVNANGASFIGSVRKVPTKSIGSDDDDEVVIGSTNRDAPVVVVDTVEFVIALLLLLLFLGNKVR